MELDKTRIEDAIVREVADGIMQESDLRDRIRRAVDERIATLFRTVADAQITEAIATAVQAGFDHEYTKVTSFGDPKGPPTTIRKELERMIAGYWQERVNSQGKPSDSGFGVVTRAEWTMMQIVSADFKDHMKQHATNVAGALKDGLRAELHRTVNSLLSELFHVKSADDQILGHSGGIGRASIDPEQNPRKPAAPAS